MESEMSEVSDVVVKLIKIDDCRRMDAVLRTDLEILDEEIRSIIARMKARTMESGGDETMFTMASSTVLLSIAAALTRRIDQSSEIIDIETFLVRANDAADWANNRKMIFDRSSVENEQHL
jgi:hypothetical protein